MTAVPKSSPALREPKTLRQRKPVDLKAHAAQMREWRRKSPEKARAIEQRSREAHPRPKHPRPVRVYPTKACAHCGSDFVARTTLARYCSLSCNREGQATKWAMKRGACEQCSAPLTHRKRKRFCSTACWYVANTKPRQMDMALPRRTKPTRACKGCGQTFAAHPSAFGRGRRYCSKECFYRTDGRSQPEEATCAECGIPFTRRPANMRQPKGPLKFCSSACSKSYFRGARSPAWRGGSNPNRGAGWLKRAEEARERDGHRCRRCGKSQEENGERLSVDHLIPWRTFDSGEEANQLDNLVSLCRICHAIKTQGPERAWLKGDVLAMQRHIEAVTLPSAGKASGFLA